MNYYYYYYYYYAFVRTFSFGSGGKSATRCVMTERDRVNFSILGYNRSRAGSKYDWYHLHRDRNWILSLGDKCLTQVSSWYLSPILKNTLPVHFLKLNHPMRKPSIRHFFKKSVFDQNGFHDGI